MSYAELIEKLETLPDEKRTEVFDFVDYLAARFTNHRDPDVEQGTHREPATAAAASTSAFAQADLFDDLIGRYRRSRGRRRGARRLSRRAGQLRAIFNSHPSATYPSFFYVVSE